ncbi:MAG: transcriptional regulator, MarR family, partial [Marmoricola sp.]|nr:transcriptional regulator, MarR family [Marmoricola sp.]
MDENPGWLTADEMDLWRGWLSLNRTLPAALHRQLQAEAGLSMQDFEVLVRLTDTEDGRVRVSDLARDMLWERSR